MPMFTCHCCGGPAPAAKQDPQRDKGFGTCEACSTALTEDNEAGWVKLETKVRAALKPENQKRFDLMGAEFRRALIGQMMDEGLITWKVRRGKA